jgi:hypothetical protein
VRPFIGIGPGTPEKAIKFLKNEGFIVEAGIEPRDYGVYLGNLLSFQETDERALAEKIENTAAPLVRYWRWPDGARSALSLTGDIDSMTLIDFGLRVVENFIQGLKKSRAHV